MSPEPKPGVIGSLPRTRPHRRSDKRPAPPGGAPPVDSQAEPPPVVSAAAPPKRRAAKATPAPAPKPRAATPPAPPPGEPSPGVLETAVQAAAELAEIGLHAGARALRRAVSRLPRP